MFIGGLALPFSNLRWEAGLFGRFMQVALRNALAELLLESLRFPAKADALHLLMAYCTEAEKGNPWVVLDTLGVDSHEEALKTLADLGLLQITEGAIGLPPEFQADRSALRAKAGMYERVLAQMIREEGEGVGRALTQAAVLFNEGLYFEVHELLEAFWMAEEDLLRKRFLQGLIQIAAGFHHLSNGNSEGAVSLLREGSEKLKGYRPTYLGVELEGVLEGIEQCSGALEQLGPHGLAAFDPSLIPKMKISLQPSGASRQLSGISPQP